MSKKLFSIYSKEGEYAALLAEKQEQYVKYKAFRQEIIDYRTMKQNVDILRIAHPITGHCI